MAIPKPFAAVKLVCGMIASKISIFQTAEEKLIRLYGGLDSESPIFPFDITDYYERQMGKNLKRKFISFERLIEPGKLSEIKHQTNRMEEEIREEYQAPRRVVNLDPGYLSLSALIMATAKDFAHRVPLQDGIYAHLEFIFGKNEVRTLDWTYPDFKSEGYQRYFLETRKIYLSQLREKTAE